MQLVERYCTWRWGEEGGGVFIIEKETMLNMVKLCVIPEKKKTILPPLPRISIPEGSSLTPTTWNFLACSRRSDSGEWCEVKRSAKKYKRGRGRGERGNAC